jgi:MFS family permease
MTKTTFLRITLLLGFTSFLTDTSSEMIMPILPFFISALGGTGLIVGLIGGLEESVSSILKVIAGYWSDKTGKRKIFVFSGYTASAVSKVFLSFSTIWQHVLIFKPIERIGKGLRTAPRDAIIADYADKEVRGKAFGLHRTLDTSGAVLGSTLTLILFWFMGLEFNTIIFIGAIIAFFALIPLYPVKEKKTEPKLTSWKISFINLPSSLRLFIVIASLFSLGNFTYMFYILRAEQLFTGRLAFAAPILLYIWFNIVFAAFSTPLGILSDKIGRRSVLLIGYFLFGLTTLLFALPISLISLVILFALYGLVFALTEGNQRALVSDLAPKKLRGTSLGTFHTAIGLASLPSGLIAGTLWQFVGPFATFFFGSACGFLAASLFLLKRL